MRFRRRKAAVDLAKSFEDADVGMPVDEALGMMTALVSTPTMQPPSEWIERIIDDAEFRSSDHAQAFMGQLMGAYNGIVERLRAGKGAGPRSGDPQVVRLWCRGYVDVARDDPQWVDEPEAIRMITPLLALAGDLEEGGIEPRLADALEKMKVESVEDLPRIVAEIDEFWRRTRPVDGAVAAVDVGAAPAVGRKRPCPCGSGKKYKRCCGAN